MKKYTQQEFNELPKNEYGVKMCPSGDYTEIKNFGERCSFGEWCSFGERCSFGKRCSFGEDCSFGERCSFEGLTNCKYIAVDRIGSENRKTYFFTADEGMFVRAGCFFGTIDEFENRVHEVHGGTKHETHYMKAIGLAKLMLAEEG